MKMFEYLYLVVSDPIFDTYVVQYKYNERLECYDILRDRRVL